MKTWFRAMFCALVMIASSGCLHDYEVVFVPVKFKGEMGIASAIPLADLQQISLDAWAEFDSQTGKVSTPQVHVWLELPKTAAEYNCDPYPFQVPNPPDWWSCDTQNIRLDVEAMVGFTFSTPPDATNQLQIVVNNLALAGSAGLGLTFFGERTIFPVWNIETFLHEMGHSTLPSRVAPDETPMAQLGHAAAFNLPTGTPCESFPLDQPGTLLDPSQCSRSAGKYNITRYGDDIDPMGVCDFLDDEGCRYNTWNIGEDTHGAVLYNQVSHSGRRVMYDYGDLAATYKNHHLWFWSEVVGPMGTECAVFFQYHKNHGIYPTLLRCDTADNPAFPGVTSHHDISTIRSGAPLELCETLYIPDMRGVGLAVRYETLPSIDPVTGVSKVTVRWHFTEDPTSLDAFPCPVSSEPLLFCSEDGYPLVPDAPCDVPTTAAPQTATTGNHRIITVPMVRFEATNCLPLEAGHAEQVGCEAAMWTYDASHGRLSLIPELADPMDVPDLLVMGNPIVCEDTIEAWGQYILNNLPGPQLTTGDVVNVLVDFICAHNGWTTILLTAPGGAEVRVSFTEASSTLIENRNRSTHEVVHTFDIFHDGLVGGGCSPDAAPATCPTIAPFGDLFSIMGSRGFLGTLAAQHQEDLGWLDPAHIANLGVGSFVLQPLTEPLTTSGIRAVCDGAAGTDRSCFTCRTPIGAPDDIIPINPVVDEGILWHHRELVEVTPDNFMLQTWLWSPTTSALDAPQAPDTVLTIDGFTVTVDTACSITVS